MYHTSDLQHQRDRAAEDEARHAEADYRSSDAYLTDKVEIPVADFDLMVELTEGALDAQSRARQSRQFLENEITKLRATIKTLKADLQAARERGYAG